MGLLEMAERLRRALVELEHGDPDGDNTVEVLSYEEVRSITGGPQDPTQAANYTLAQLVMSCS